jgi:23S rRNA (cytidine1920-2'-O)/16S rRNA (cytidine1409-2'-O)-methyltransferase
MRLDQYLVFKKYFISRHQAHEYIITGGVLVNGEPCIKSSYAVKENDVITANKQRFVSRAGHKLEAALQHWKISLQGKSVLDIGSSTGGFVDCALQYGARRVYAVDVGIHQLSTKLKNDSRVVSIEHTDIREYKTVERFDVITVDVSFISLEKIIPELGRFIVDNGSCILLIKPQFEVGKENIGKGGLVKDKKMLAYAQQKVTEMMIRYHFIPQGPCIISPLKGGEGQIEYLGYYCLDTGA